MNTNSIEDLLIKEKEDRLIEILKKYKRIAIGLSGGVDSSLLVYYAVKVLGLDNVLALTGVSSIVVPLDLEMAYAIVAITKVRHEILERTELQDSNFLKNDTLRCYYCKKLFFSTAKEFASKEGFDIFCDGTNASDKNDYRPGERAMIELDVKSPLREADIDKDMVYILSKRFNLPTSDKKSDSCFATRIPCDEPITIDALNVIASAEDFLHKLGFEVVRVRYHNELARIEVLEKDILIIMQEDNRKLITQYFKTLGFVWTAVDMLGYKMGSMNKVPAS